MGERAQPGLLTLKDLSLSFGGVRAIDGVDFEIKTGEVHGLIGPNGSGKTTILNVISGYYAPQEGHVRLDGKALRPRSPHTRAGLHIARTFQTPRVIGDTSVLENVMVGGTTQGRGSFVASLLALSRHRRDEAHLREAATAAPDRVARFRNPRVDDLGFSASAKRAFHRLTEERRRRAWRARERCARFGCPLSGCRWRLTGKRGISRSAP